MGTSDEDDFGPVINETQLNKMIASIQAAKKDGVNVVMGGKKSLKRKHVNGFYLEPTLLENVDSDHDISKRELFGPITILYSAIDYNNAIELAEKNPYGLTACIHTKNINRAHHFVQHIKAGVAVVNAGTHGSEPHMPFGGYGLSGNGSREPGTEAIDIYSELKDVYINIDIDNI